MLNWYRQRLNNIIRKTPVQLFIYILIEKNAVFYNKKDRKVDTPRSQVASGMPLALI